MDQIQNPSHYSHHLSSSSSSSNTQQQLYSQQPLFSSSPTTYSPSTSTWANRDEHFLPQVQPPTLPNIQPLVKRESMDGKSQPARTSEDPMPSTSDFVKKLYKMLEDPSFQSVVCWGPMGDCFVVKDMNEFTKSILPRMFKHSNFASFVRQLNKYDFHKVKNTDDNQFGEHSWTFRHPDFHADRRDALENIKRKVPSARKSNSAAAAAQSNPTTTHPLSSHPYRRSPSPTSLSSLHHSSHLASASSVANNNPALLAEIQRLKDEGDDLRGRIRNLERNYESVLVEMVGFQRGMAQQDGLMQSLISYFLGNESVPPNSLPALLNSLPASLSQSGLPPDLSTLMRARKGDLRITN